MSKKEKVEGLNFRAQYIACLTVQSWFRKYITHNSVYAPVSDPFIFTLIWSLLISVASTLNGGRGAKDKKITE